ncbi:MAG: glycogen synthase [Bacteroidia bacterium]|nr:MAG: glycogen synthase [Bacteroidia bacterium]
MEKEKQSQKKVLSAKQVSKTMLFEIAWEVCNQVGGIYTVIRSKLPSVKKTWGDDNYCLLGPYIYEQAAAVFEPITDSSDPIAQAVKLMSDNGFNDVHYGRWLVSGRPRTVLFNPFTVFNKLNEIKYELWEHHGISTPGDDDMMNKIVAFGYQVKEFFKFLTSHDICTREIIAHFHEWMAATPIPEIRREKMPVKVVFTTHATLLGRYLAMNANNFYSHLPYFDWEKEANHFNIYPQVFIERAAAHGSHIFTTVSDVTALECKYLLGRNPDTILPNGLNTHRYEAVHEFQNLHVTNKAKIHEFSMSHFFPCYSFDLDKTLYFFTSGRYEYQNKGFDITLEALARLNWKMKEANHDHTVITFFVTRQPYHNINPRVMESRAMMEEIGRICKNIEKQIGERLFRSITSNQIYKFPDLNKELEDYWRLRLRRTIQQWKSGTLPSVVTHNLVDDSKDEILNFVRTAQLINRPDDKVKIIYHPDFISPTNPLFRMEYGDFVRGCHLGIFPSYYEPWGYTPLECIASGIPAVTSDLAGFGDYVLRHIENPAEKGIFVVNRKDKSFDESAEQLANILFDFVNQKRRERISGRNTTEASSLDFDWDKLRTYYDKAYKQALKMKL